MQSCQVQRTHFGVPPRYRESDNRAVLERSGSYRRSIAITRDSKEGQEEEAEGKNPGTHCAREERKTRYERGRMCIVIRIRVAADDITRRLA